MAEGGVSASLRRDGRGGDGVYGGHVNLVHDVGLGGDMDGLREAVIPGGIVLLEVVVGVFSLVDAVGASVEVVVD